MFLFDKIIHIVPEYPPHVGGVADFSAIIKDSMNAWGVPQVVLVAGIKPVGYEFEKDVVISNKNGSLVAALKQHVGTNTLVIFHYVCYGYSLKGIPVFLPGIFKRFKEKYNVTVLTYFHELYASESSPLKSAFWLGFIQKIIAKKISYLSDLRFTTSASYKLELDTWNYNTKNRNVYMPVFSNIPEHPNWANMKEKQQVVVFGSKGARNKIYKDKAIVESLLNKTLQCDWVDIGVPIEVHSSIKRLGQLSAVQVSMVLAASTWGVIEYEDMPIEKSGVFAAYVLNGVVPIVLNCSKEPSAYQPGIHYIAYNENSSLYNHIENEKIRINAYKKYKELASIDAHMKKINELLGELKLLK